MAALPTPAGAWGFTGHRLVNRKAALTLPSPLRELFAGNADFLAEHSIDPDLWRAAGLAGEGPNHYLDLDAFGEWPFAEVPHVEAQHLARFGAAAREKGRVPWRALEVYRDLVEAFRAGDPALVLERAAVLGHYVGDAHVPFHAILNYDGQLTGQEGIHARYESEMVDRYLRQIEPEVAPGEARSGAVPVALVFEALLESAALTDEAPARGPRVRRRPGLRRPPRRTTATPTPTTRPSSNGRARASSARLSLAAERLGSLWLSAWEEAGRPPVPAAFRVPYVRRRSRLIVASLDGAAAPVVADAVARGVMPHLAALRAAGATAAGSITSWPAKTASGHATLYTGAWPDVHGVTGNEVVLPGASLLEPVSGYQERTSPRGAAVGRRRSAGARGHPALRDPGLSVRAVRVGPSLRGRLRRRASRSSPATRDPGSPMRCIGRAICTARAPSGWPGRPRGAGIPGDRAPGRRQHGLRPALGRPRRPAVGFDTLALAINKDGPAAARLKPGLEGGAAAFASVPVPPRRARPARLLSLVLPLGRRQGPPPLPGPGGRLPLEPLPAAGLRHARPPAASWATPRPISTRPAQLGPTLPEGGDGTAERRYLETARLAARQFERLLEFGATRTPWQVLVGYLPFPDEFLHLWWGFLDPALPGHDPGLAGRLRPFLDEGLRIADGYVGALRRHADADTVLAIGADHGMAAVRTRVRMNAALRDAALLALDASGRIDLARTKVHYLAASGYFQLNRAGRPGGLVPPSAEASVRAATAAMLRGLRDPRTGKALVTEVLAPGSGAGPGRTPGRRRVLPARPPRLPRRRPGRGGGLRRRRRGGSTCWIRRSPTMHASFVVAGPGVAAGELGVIRQVDIAPTLSALLGIGPPAQSSGAVSSPGPWPGRGAGRARGPGAPGANRRV